MSPGKRRSREETREIVVEAALDLIREEGLGVEPTTISYQKVFAHLERTKGIRITRASVHERIWDSQEDFQLDVLLRVSRVETGAGAAEETAARLLASTDETDPLRLMQLLGRHTPDAVLSEAAADPLFYSWVGFTLSLAKESGNHRGRRQALADATAEEYEAAQREGAELVQALAAVLGVRPRRALFGPTEDAFALIARLGLALAEGATVRMRFDSDELPSVLLRTGAGGTEEEWSTFAAGYWALLNTFLEVDPDAHPVDEAPDDD